MQAKQSDITSLLQQHGYSITRPRKAVFQALSDTGPVTMAQLVNKLRFKINRASVYRTVKLFEKIGAVHRIQTGWKYKIELGEIFTEHHHHASCVQCGVVIAIEEDGELEKKIKQTAEANGFTRVHHSLEINGICNTCSSKISLAT